MNNKKIKKVISFAVLCSVALFITTAHAAPRSKAGEVKAKNKVNEPTRQRTAQTNASTKENARKSQSEYADPTKLNLDFLASWESGLSAKVLDIIRNPKTYGMTKDGAAYANALGVVTEARTSCSSSFCAKEAQTLLETKLVAFGVTVNDVLDCLPGTNPF